MDFGPLRAIGYEEQLRTATPGGAVEFEVLWQATSVPERDYDIRLTLRDATGEVAHTAEMPLAAGYPTSAWQAGEVVRTLTLLPVPALEPGSYRLELELPGAEGQLALGQVEIAGQARLYEIPPLSHPLEAQLGSEIALLGYELSPESLRPSETLNLRLVWRAESTMTASYKVFVHVIGADGVIYGQDDSIPAQWQRPTPGWEVGEIIVDEHVVTVKAEASAGECSLMIGMYDEATFARLPIVVGGQAQANDNLRLAGITITER